MKKAPKSSGAQCWQMASTAEGAGVAARYQIDEGPHAPRRCCSYTTSLRTASGCAGVGARCIRYDPPRLRRARGAPSPTFGHDRSWSRPRTPWGCCTRSGLTGVVVVGIGFGGLIALDLALRHGELTRAVVASDRRCSRSSRGRRGARRAAPRPAGLDGNRRPRRCGRGVARAGRRPARSRAQGVAARALRRLRRPGVVAGHPRAAALVRDPRSRSSPRRRPRGTSRRASEALASWSRAHSAARTATSLRQHRAGVTQPRAPNVV